MRFFLSFELFSGAMRVGSADMEAFAFIDAYPNAMRALCSVLTDRWHDLECSVSVMRTIAAELRGAIEMARDAGKFPNAKLAYFEIEVRMPQGVWIQ